MSSMPPPAAPDPLMDWMRRFGGVEPAGAGAHETAEAALRALGEALSRPGRDREGAYALLAADALLTDAARGLAGGHDPESGLLELMDRIAQEEPG
jgi:hypothetical protein